MRFSSHPNHQKVRKNALQPVSPKFTWGVYLAQLGDPSGGGGWGPFKHPIIGPEKIYVSTFFWFRPLGDPLWDPFWTHFGPIVGPILDPFWTKIWVNNSTVWSLWVTIGA